MSMTMTISAGPEATNIPILESRYDKVLQTLSILDNFPIKERPAQPSNMESLRLNEKQRWSEEDVSVYIALV